MWTEKLRQVRRAGWLGVAGFVAAASVSCTPSYVTDSSAPVNLIVAGITSSQGGIVLDSDIRNGEFSSFVCPDYAAVSVAVRNKNPLAPTPSVPSAVIIDSYTVRYFRTDGRGVEGVDVPYRITGNLTAAVDVLSSGTSDIPVEVVRRQAKMEPPLTTIFQAASVLTTMAEITFYGQTVSGERVSGSGFLQIDFADYGDKLTECEAQ